MDEVPFVALPIHLIGVAHPDPMVRVLRTQDILILDLEENR
jgi:hypothetical protein